MIFKAYSVSSFFILKQPGFPISEKSNVGFLKFNFPFLMITYFVYFGVINHFQNIYLDRKYVNLGAQYVGKCGQPGLSSISGFNQQ